MKYFFFLSFLFSLYFSLYYSYTCPSTCVASSNCQCGSKSIPGNGNIPLSQIPQFVFFTIDDAVVEETNYSILDRVEVHRKNKNIRDANNCPIRPTIYTLSKNSDFSLISYFEKIGSVSLHTVTHTTDYDTTYQKWRNELETCYKDIKELAAVQNIYGSRAPYLNCNDNYYKVLKELGILYDSSSSYYSLAWNIGKPSIEQRNFWPFTLDYGFPEDILAYSANMQIPQPVPGLWVVPMTGYHHLSGQTYELMDYDVKTNPAQALEDFQRDFERNYNTNKAPLGYYFHSYYFLDSEGNVDQGIIDWWTNFLEWIATKHDKVLFATEDRAIKWMKDPKATFEETLKMPEFQCSCFPLPDNACNDNKKRKVCQKPGPVVDTTPTYTICGKSCPIELPDINRKWSYQDNSPRTYSNDPFYFNTPLNGVISNVNYPRFTGKVTLGYRSGVWTVPGHVCANIFVENPSSLYGANGLIITVNWCTENTVLDTYDFPRGTKVDYTYGSKTGFRMIGNSQSAFMRYVTYDFGHFCLKINNDGYYKFEWDNIKIGMDFYRNSLFCDLNSNDPSKKCTMFCGNNVCDPGEDQYNCGVDCLPDNCI